MNFYDTVTKMGYTINSKDTNSILISKEYHVAISLILFDTKDKTIYGAIKTTDLVSTIDQVTNWYAAFRDMRKDVKKLSDLSGYDII